MFVITPRIMFFCKLVLFVLFIAVGRASISIEEIGRLAATRTKAFNNVINLATFLDILEARFREFTTPQQIFFDFDERSGSVEKVRVDSWVFVPKNLRVDKKVDIIVHLHGGPQNSVFFPSPYSPKKSALELLYFASRGFMIIAVNYRGTYDEKFKVDFEGQAGDVYNSVVGTLAQLDIKNYGSIYLNGFDHGVALAIFLLTKVYSYSPSASTPYKNIFSGAILYSGIYSNSNENPHLWAEKMIPEVPLLIVQGTRHDYGLRHMRQFSNRIWNYGRRNITFSLTNCGYHIADESTAIERDGIFEGFIREYEKFVNSSSMGVSLQYADFFLKKAGVNEVGDPVSYFNEHFLGKDYKSEHIPLTRLKDGFY